MSEPTEEDNPFERLITEDLGDTPGNDRALKLACGHTVLESLGHNNSGGQVGSWVGGTTYCYFCDKDE